MRFIDGREEARLTFAGVTASVALGEGLDPVARPRRREPEGRARGSRGTRWGRSLPIGAGRMTGLVVTHDPPTREERKAVRSAVVEAVAPLVQGVAVAEPARCVASGGTAGASRACSPRTGGDAARLLNQYEVTVSELRDLTRELATLSLAERSRRAWTNDAPVSPPAAGSRRARRPSWREAPRALRVGLREGAVLDARSAREPSVTDA